MIIERDKNLKVKKIFIILTVLFLCGALIMMYKGLYIVFHKEKIINNYVNQLVSESYFNDDISRIADIEYKLSFVIPIIMGFWLLIIAVFLYRRNYLAFPLILILIVYLCWLKIYTPNRLSLNDSLLNTSTEDILIKNNRYFDEDKNNSRKHLLEGPEHPNYKDLTDSAVNIKLRKKNIDKNLSNKVNISQFNFKNTDSVSNP